MLAVLLLAALLPVVSIDTWIYGHGRFTRVFGENSHEGQDLSKIRRGRQFARDADVIVFGGSYARYGISSKPFRDAGILEWNFAVSGGGPVSSYYALKAVAPIVAARRHKPAIVLEVFSEAIQRSGGAGWSELVHLNGLARSRSTLLADYRPLLSLARDYGVVDQLLVQTALPSSVLRKYVAPIVTDHRLEGYWYLADDDFGYAPMQDVAPPSTRRPESMTLDQISPSKLEFIRLFLRLARETGSRVFMLSSAQKEFVGAPFDRYDALYGLIAKEFPDVGFVKMPDYGLVHDDFGADGWDHPNVRGADKISRAIIRQTGLTGDVKTLPQRLLPLFDEVPVPQWEAWTGAFVPVPQSGPTAFSFQAREGAPNPSFTLPPLTPGTELLVETITTRRHGYLSVCLRNAGDAAGGQCSGDTIGAPVRLEHTRIYNRIRSTGTPISVTFQPMDGGAGVVDSVRIVTDKADRLDQ